MAAAPSKQATERLEVPSQNAIERRLLVTEAAPTVKPAISRPPQSALLGRLQQFLPQMEEANAQLAGHTQEEAQMEQSSEGEGPYVELDLACGLFDLKDAAAVAAAERALVDPEVVIERYSGGNSDSNSDSDSCSSDSDSAEGQAAREMEQSGDAALPDSPPGEGAQAGASNPAPRRKTRRPRAGIEELT